MQELSYIQPKGFTFRDMPTTSENVQAQILMAGILMMHMGDHLTEAIRNMRKPIEENQL